MLSRLKFKIEPLVNEMLDQIPQDVLIYGKVLDPAMGGGQFVKEVERRKRAAGLTDEQIKATTFGIERNILCRNYAVNKNKLVGTYDIGNFLEMESSMKFDVIVGNPPYQDGNNNSNQNKIYNQFSKKSISILTQSGCVALVTPTSVLKESKRFSLLGQPGLKIVDFRADNYFTVGTSICWWLIDKTYIGKVTVTHNAGSSQHDSDKPIYDYSKVDFDFSQLYQVLKKVTDTPKKRMFKQNNFGPALSKVKDTKHEYPLYKLDDGVGILTCYSARPPYFQGKYKFVISRTKSFNDRAIIISNNDYDTAHMFTEIHNDDEIENIKSFLFSEYFIAHSGKWKAIDGYGFNDCLKYIPPFDQTKKWTSNEVQEFLEGFKNK